MKFKICLLLLVLLSFTTDHSNAGRFFGGGRSRGGGRRPTSTRPAAPTSFGQPSRPNKPPTSFGHPPSPSGTHVPSHPSAPPAPPSYPGHGGTSTGGHIGFSKPPGSPSVPPPRVSEQVPRINNNNVQSSNPSSPFGTNNQPYTPGQSSPPWSNPHINGAPNPPPPGFKKDVLPVNNAPSHPYPPSTSFNPSAPHPPSAPYHPNVPHSPSAPYNPNVPHYPSGSYNPNVPHVPQGVPGTHYPSPHYPSSSYPSPHYPGPQSIPPLGNPYSVHPPSYGHPTYGNGYGSPVGAGQPYHPQQTILSQPAAQPYVPGQTVIMVPGQQDSGRGVGQLVKEALIFSTVNAAVNRVVNPHTYHYHDSRPAETPANAGDTHITYNINYPGANGVPSPPGAPIPPGLPTPPGVSIPPGNTPTANTNVNYPYPYPVYTPPTNPAFQVVPTSIDTRQSNNPNPGNAATNTNNQSATPNNDQANVPPFTVQYKISDDELRRLAEDLYKKQDYQVGNDITLNLQGQWTSGNITDLASSPLLSIRETVQDYPTIMAMRALYDNYERNSSVKEVRTLEKRKEENILLDLLLTTDVVNGAMQWLADRGFIDPDDFERKEVLRQIWFHQFSGTTSGFERVFTSEIYGSDLLGVQDWIYFDYAEKKGILNYMGYVNKLNFSDNASLLKLNFQIDGIIRPNATIFVGTMPELEIALYTVCFYARPNDLCPVSFGGAQFYIFTHSFRYYGKDLIDLAFPIFQ